MVPARLKQLALRERICLNLLGTPASGLGLAHVGRRLDRRNELEANVADADEPNDGAGNDSHPAVVQED